MSAESINKPTSAVASNDETALARMKALSSQAPTTTVQTGPVHTVRPPILPAIRTDFLKAAAEGAPQKEPEVKAAVTNENPDPLAPHTLPRGSNREVNVETNANINHPEVKAAAERMRAGQRPLNQELITGLSPGAKLLDTDQNYKIPADSPEAQAIHKLMDKKIRLNTPLSEQENQDLNNNIKSLSQSTGVDEGLLREHLLAVEKMDQYVIQEVNKVMPTIIDEDTRYGMFDADLKQSLRRMASESADPTDRPEYKELIRLNAHNLDMDPTQLDERAREYIKAVKELEHESQTSIAKGELAQSLQESLTATPDANYISDAIRMHKNIEDLQNLFGKVNGVTSTRMTPEQLEFMTAIHETEHHKSGKLGQHKFEGEKSYYNTLPGEIDADLAAIRAARNMNEPELAEAWLRMRNINGFTRTAPSHDTAPYIRAMESRDGQQLLIDSPVFPSHEGIKNAFLERKLLLERIDEQIVNRHMSTPGQVMAAVEDVLKKDAAETDPGKKMSPAQIAWSKEFLQDARAEGHTPDRNYQRTHDVDPKAYDHQAVISALQSTMQVIKP